MVNIRYCYLLCILFVSYKLYNCHCFCGYVLSFIDFIGQFHSQSFKINITLTFVKMYDLIT